MRITMYKQRKHWTLINVLRSGRPTKITQEVYLQLIQEVTTNPEWHLNGIHTAVLRPKSVQTHKGNKVTKNISVHRNGQMCWVWNFLSGSRTSWKMDTVTDQQTWQWQCDGLGLLYWRTTKGEQNSYSYECCSLHYRWCTSICLCSREKNLNSNSKSTFEWLKIKKKHRGFRLTKTKSGLT